MSLLFVTVGTSSINNPKIGTVENADNTALLAEVAVYLKAEDKSPEHWTGLRGRLIEAHMLYWRQTESYVSDPSNFYETCAELISTWRMFPLLASRQPPRTVDHIILLASSTPDGQFAADVVLGVMKSNEYAVPVQKDRISKHVIPGLDKEFVDLSEAIPALVREYRSDPAAGLVHFNVTGGFKGTAVVIGMLALEHGFALFYQHESLRVPIFINPKGRMSRRPE